MNVQQAVSIYTHTVGNVLFPDTLLPIAERLSTVPEYRKEALLLTSAYHAEVNVKLQGALLSLRCAGGHPETFRMLIRGCRRTATSKEPTKSVEDILDYAVSRVTARFLDQHYARINSVRTEILAKKGVTIAELKEQFEDDILLNKSIRPTEWVNTYLRPICVAELSPLWKKVFILSDSHAEALLFSYFSEILFNAFKYADHDKVEFLSLVFGEETVNGKVYLTCSWENPVADDRHPALGTGSCLDAFREDLKILNYTKNSEESLMVYRDTDKFKVTLFFKKDLLVNDGPKLSLKRFINR